MKKSAQDNIADFLKDNPVWFSAADLQRKEFKNKDMTNASPKAISRRLQELAEGEHAILEVSYGHKNAASYKIKEQHRKTKQVVHYLPNNTVKIEYIPV